MAMAGEYKSGEDDIQIVGYQAISDYQDRGGVLLHDCKSIRYMPEKECRSPFTERRVEILCSNGEADVCGLGIHANIYPKK